MTKVLIAILTIFIFLNPLNEIKIKEIFKIGDKGTPFLQISEVKAFKDGSIVVSDKLSYEILVFDRKGKLVKKVGKKGKNNLEFNGPNAIAISNNEHLAISDFSSSKVQILDKNLNHLRTFYVKGAVFDLEYDNENYLWVAMVKGDGNVVLTKYDKNGKSLFSLSPKNSTKDEFIFKGTFHFDIYDNKIIVGHTLQNRVEIWDTKGKFVKDFKVVGLPELSKKKIFSVELFSKKYVPEGIVIWGVSTDQSGRIFILGAKYSKNPYKEIFIYDLEGNYLNSLYLPQKINYFEIINNDIILVVCNDRTLIKSYQIISSG